MNRLEYVNKLLEKDDLTQYIKDIEENSSISPPKDLKEEILAKCYGKANKSENVLDEKENKVYKFSLSFSDILKVACFALVITLCTELFMSSTYATSTKEENVQIKNKIAIYKVTTKIDCAVSKFSDFMLDNNLKGD